MDTDRTLNITVDQGATYVLNYSTPVPIPGWARLSVKATQTNATPELVVWATPTVTSSTNISLVIPSLSTYFPQRQNFYQLDITNLQATPTVTRVQKGKLYLDRT